MGDSTPADARVRPHLGLPERYEPVRHIATGGMASVWCAHDQALGRSVAIKLLAERYADDPLASERFMREARAAARLSGHPNVVMIYDVGEAEPVGNETSRVFIVMEYLAGGTVADALRVDSVRRVHAVRWVHEAASALDYAHSRGVLHRDIKPANLLLDRDRTLHVADFGIARLGAEDTITGSGQLLGTAAYLAPERALGRPATEASDRYSLAVAAYELLVGERPFTAQHFAAQARQHLEEEPPLASTRNRALPPAVDRVLARGMAKRPEQRWPTAQAFAQALEAALTEPATRPHRVAAAPVRPRTPRRAGAGAVASEPAAALRSPRATPTRTVPVSAPAAPAPRPRPPVAAPGPRPRRHRGRVAALAALAAAAIVAIGAVATIGAGGGPKRVNSAQARRPATTSAVRKPAPAKSTAKPRTTATVTATSAAATTPAPVADTLEARGHELMVEGDYDAAIPVLRQAVGAASPASLTYAYALYDLGRSLRLAGDPRQAVEVLYQRLQIPNQTEVVREQLQLALLALGQQARGGGAGVAPAPGGPPAPGRHGHGGGPTPPGGGPPAAGGGPPAAGGAADQGD